MGQEAGEKGKKLRNSAQYFAIEKYSFLPSRIITYLLTGNNFVTPGRVIEVLRKGTRVYILSI